LKPDIAIEHLELILAALPEDGTLLELGSGWSTVWFAERLGENQRLVSVEHDKTWWETIIPRVVNNLKVAYQLCVPTLPVGPYGSFHRENPAGAEAFIHAYPYHGAHVIFIDGLARGACLVTALLQGNPGTRIFLHDAQRDWYTWAKDLAKDFQNHGPAEGHPSSLWEARL